MSAPTNFITTMINNALMQTHTAFFARVISVRGNKAKVQPLNMIKMKGGKAQKQPVITNVPILQHVGGITKGDTVFCMCAERDITETRKGKFALPASGRHMLSDAVVIGKI